VGDPDDLGPEVPDKLAFRIGEVAELVGVEPHVLRYWEAEFRIRPQRSTSGQRMYRRKDIARFLKIKKLLHDEGFTIAGARKAMAEGEGRAAPTGPLFEAGRLGEALERVEALRGRIRGLRRRLGVPLGEPPREEPDDETDADADPDQD
jgi:DNA-binding transcriptional MerR regulator